jgi:hypothetical protein
MLHSNLAMTRVKLSLVILLISTVYLGNSIAHAQNDVQPIVDIAQPLPGEAAQGLIQVTGTIMVEDLVSYRLEFAYQEENNQSWFGISNGNTPISEGILGEWDTSSIPDSNYDLRLTVNRETAEPIVLIVEGIRVRNYSAIETNTPAPTNILPSQTPTVVESVTVTPTVEVLPSPTALAPNPAAITGEDIQINLIKGALGGVAIFILFLIYRGTRTRR